MFPLPGRDGVLKVSRGVMWAARGPERPSSPENTWQDDGDKMDLGSSSVEMP